MSKPAQPLKAPQPRPSAGANRRDFLYALGSYSVGWAGIAGAGLPGSWRLGESSPRQPETFGELSGRTKIRLGMITDVHQDVMHDGVERLSAFVSAMQQAGVDTIAQLGDFCVPHPRNDSFLAAWNQFPGKKLHVLGNHDMDGGYRREQTVEYYGCPARYYSTSVGDLQVIVLDGNDPDGRPGYPCNVGDEQQEWLRQELAEHRRPTIVLIHQPIDAYDRHVRSAPQVRAILSAAKLESGHRQVLGVFAGHAHLDYLRVTDGIPHFQLNSASYYWVSQQHENYGPEIQKQHPSLGP